MLFLFSKKNKRKRKRKTQAGKKQKKNFIILVRIIFMFVVNSCNRTSKKPTLFIHNMCTCPRSPPYLTTEPINFSFLIIPHPERMKKKVHSLSHTRLERAGDIRLHWFGAMRSRTRCASVCSCKNSVNLYFSAIPRHPYPSHASYYI